MARAGAVEVVGGVVVVVVAVLVVVVVVIVVVVAVVVAIAIAVLVASAADYGASDVAESAVSAILQICQLFQSLVN